MPSKPAWYEVEWIDSASPRSRWMDPNEAAQAFLPAICFTAGVLLRKDKECVVIAGSVGESNVGDVTAIPRKAVLKMRRLK